jgi:endonuclease-8
MAEGPLVHYYARKLDKILKGKVVDIEFRLKKLKSFESSFQKVTIDTVEAHGKQFRIYVSNNRIILVHLMMFGSWRIYKRGAEWDKPLKQARMIIRSATHECVVFSAPVVKVFTQEEFETGFKWSNLGPDPLRNDFSSAVFISNLEKHGDREIGELLLDQQVVAGIGNILRIEILFKARVHPHRLVNTLTSFEKKELLRWTLTLMNQWIKEMSRKKKTWILLYRKSGQPCPDCGTEIEFFRQGGRITYACPVCQT